MRHNVKKGLKLGTDASHTKAMKKSLAKALFENDRIKTTETRAKALRSVVDPIITWAKKGDLHSRRLAIAKLGDKQLVAEIFDKAAQGMWQDRNGGYTRIMKLGNRKGDNAPIVIMELVTDLARLRPRSCSGPQEAAAPKKVEAARRPLPRRLLLRRPLSRHSVCIGYIRGVRSRTPLFLSRYRCLFVGSAHDCAV